MLKGKLIGYPCLRFLFLFLFCFVCLFVSSSSFFLILAKNTFVEGYVSN